MPLLRITTNVSLDETRQQQVLEACSAAIAELLGKPETYVMVALQPATPMLFGGSNEALAYLELKSLGLPEDKTSDFSATLCNLMSDQLGVDAARVYIEFSGPARHMWGWDSRTF